MLKKRSSFKITRAVLFALVLREVRGRLSKNRMGLFWFLFEPIAHILLLLIIFSTLRHRTMPGVDLPLFLINGIVPFLVFKNISLKGMEAVNANQGLFAYRQVKPFDMVAARMVVEISLMACVYVLMLLGLWWLFGYNVLIHQPLQWMLILVTGCGLAFGSALIFCVIIDALPEAATVIRLMYMPLYLISGVIFPIWLLPESYVSLLLWNPYLHLIELLRENSIAYYPKVDQVNYFYPAVCAVLSLFIGMSLYRLRRLRLAAS